MPFNAADVVRTVRLKGEKGEVVLNKTSGGTWQFEKPAGFGDADVEGDMAGAGADAAAERRQAAAHGPVARSASTAADDFIENVTDFKQYGLEPGKEAGPRIEVVRKQGRRRRPAGDRALTIGKKEEKGDKVFVRPGNENVRCQGAGPT